MDNSLSKSSSSPCLVIAGMHGRHSQEQEKLIASRDFLSDAFGVFNGSHQRAQRSARRYSTSPRAFSTPVKPPATAETDKSCQKRHAVAAKSCENAERRRDITVSPSEVCEVVPIVVRDSDKADDKRRKALDAKLLRDLVVLGMQPTDSSTVSA